MTEHGVNQCEQGRIITVQLLDEKSGGFGSTPPETALLSSMRSLEIVRYATFRNPSQLIPSQLSMLRNLTYMDISDNLLTGSLPTYLGDFTQLTSLHLGFNKNVNGPIPSEIGRLSNLRSLYLLGNDLSGTVPNELGSLSRLERLFIHDNRRLTGTLPMSICLLENIKVSLDCDMVVCPSECPCACMDVSAERPGSCDSAASHALQLKEFRSFAALQKSAGIVIVQLILMKYF